MKSIAGWWGGTVGRYGRARVSDRSLRLVGDLPLPDQPLVCVAWHEFNLISLGLHRLIRKRPAFSFIPGGLKGAAVRTWIGEFGIVPVAIRGDAHDGLALRQMRKALADGADVIVAVDGPEGPRREVRRGALWLAAASGAPMVPFGCAAAPSFRLRRWDRHLIPFPGAAIVAAIGAPIARDRRIPSEAAAANLARTLDRLADEAAAALARGDGETIDVAFAPAGEPAGRLRGAT